MPQNKGKGKQNKKPPAKNRQSRTNLHDFLKKEWKQDPATKNFGLTDIGKRALNGSIARLTSQIEQLDITKLDVAATAISDWLKKIPDPVIEFAIIALATSLGGTTLFGSKLLTSLFIKAVQSGETLKLLKSDTKPTPKQLTNALVKDILGFNIFSKEELENGPRDFLNELDAGQLMHYSGILARIADAQVADGTTMDGKAYRAGPALRKFEIEHPDVLKRFLKSNVSFEEARQDPEHSRELINIALHEWDPGSSFTAAVRYAADRLDFAVNLEKTKKEWHEAKFDWPDFAGPGAIGCGCGSLIGCAGLVAAACAVCFAVLSFIIVGVATTGLIALAYAIV